MRRSNPIGTRSLRYALAALAVLVCVTAVLAHTYRLDDTGDFIVSDMDDVRRLVVGRGTAFNVSVIDNGGCSADIRASGGNGRIVSVDNPKSDGYVVNHQFHFRAQNVGTTTYDISVLGEAANGGNPSCDEDSHNPLVIQVVEPGGDDRFFAAAVRPEIKSAKQALKQLQADLRKQYGVIYGDLAAKRITFILAMQQVMLAFNFAYFQQSDLVRTMIDAMRDQARETLLADSFRSVVGVPNGLLRGGCGAWDSFVADANALLLSAHTRTRADTKKALGQLINLYDRDGGIAGFTQWIDCDDCYDCEGVTLVPFAYQERPSVRVASILSLATREQGSNDVIRQILVAARARGDGLNSADAVVSDSNGELARQTQQFDASKYFVNTLTLPLGSISTDLRLGFESSDVTLSGRGERFQAPNLFFGAKALSPF